jgi:hypothetical protein
MGRIIDPTHQCARIIKFERAEGKMAQRARLTSGQLIRVHRSRESECAARTNEHELIRGASARQPHAARELAAPVRTRDSGRAPDMLSVSRAAVIRG